MRGCLANKPLFANETLEIGSRIDLEPRAWIVITGCDHKHDPWQIFYVLHDYRPRLLHRDSSHGYTTNPALSLSEEPEAVPEHVQGEISREADQGGAYARTRRRLWEERIRYSDRLASATGRSAARITFQIDRIDGYLAE
jgi:hypothetical protein